VSRVPRRGARGASCCTQLNYALDLLRGIKSVDTETKKKAEAN
jgi:hypothetical protein